MIQVDERELIYSCKSRVVLLFLVTYLVRASGTSGFFVPSVLLGGTIAQDPEFRGYTKVLRTSNSNSGNTKFIRVESKAQIAFSSLIRRNATRQSFWIAH